MCEQLTSCGIKIGDHPELAIHTTNSHSQTWHELKLEPIDSENCQWREMEWKDGQNQPSIRFRDLEHWQTRESFVAHCCKHAKTVYARGCTGLAKLDCPKNARIIR